MDEPDDQSLYPPCEPYRTGMLAVDPLHRLYWEESGNPDGEPVLFLHGGPGGEAAPANRQLFDPDHYRIVLFDQRGAGRSMPLGDVRNNTTQHLVQDIERLRGMLGIDKWLICGGSWGSCLALAYGETHPEACSGFLLRGVLLGTVPEIDWFLSGIRTFFPEAHDEFIGWMSEEECADPLSAYMKVLFSTDRAAAMRAAQNWVRYARSCASLLPSPDAIASSANASSFGEGRLHAHYCAHRMFLDDEQLLQHLGRIAHLPAIIVQGRQDVICPPFSAYRLHRAWPGSRLHIIPGAGHSPTDPPLRNALVNAARQFQRVNQASRMPPCTIP
jgi:proline iminopeptidase